MRFLTGLLALVGVVAICLAITGVVYFFGGFYDVSAARGGNAPVAWAVRNVREASVNSHYHAPKPPAWFNTPKAVQEGAHEVTEEGCVRCHGAPGRKPDRFARGMDPNPPDLGKAVSHDPPEKVFWVIKNGIRMTGMPAFGNHMKDDEIWRAVAFAQNEGSVTPMQYEKWSKAGEEGEKGDHEGTKGEAGGHEGAKSAPAPTSGAAPAPAPAAPKPAAQ